jgi:hypothetical protein
MSAWRMSGALAHQEESIEPPERKLKGQNWATASAQDLE